MFKIPDTYYQNNEDYITLPVIWKFIDAHPTIKSRRNETRIELLKDILTYADQSDDCKEEVLSWIDEVLQEGIKDIYLQYTPLPDNMSLLFTTQANIERHLRNYTNLALNQHVCMNKYGKNYALVSAVYSKDEYGQRITFTYCKKLHTYDRIKHSSKPIDYPVTADYFLDQEWLLVRAKPRSNLYLYEPDGFVLEAAETTTTEKEIRQVMHLAEKIIGVETPVNARRAATTAVLKNKIFKLLDKYSQTPAEIAEVISNHNDLIQQICGSIQKICTIPNLCELPLSMQSDVVGDISNIIEKYLSINWKNKKIFIQDRDAYPIKISATDEEESKVEQTAAATEPLQTKALFFDNKKMLYKSKSCDGVTLRWLRKNPIPLQSSSFCVRIAANPKGECVFKFSEYAAKEDIENVVFSIING